MKMIEEEKTLLEDTMMSIGGETIHIEETMKMIVGEMTIILEEITKKCEDNHSRMNVNGMIRQEKLLCTATTTTLLLRRLKSAHHQQPRLHLRPVLQTPIANVIAKIRRVKKVRKVRKRKVKDHLELYLALLSERCTLRIVINRGTT